MNKIKNNVRMGNFVLTKENEHNKALISSKKPSIIASQNVDSDSDEEEPKAWEAISLEFKDAKRVINTLGDNNLIVWNKKKKLGKISHKNFNEWCDVIIEDLHKMQKKNDDNDIFN